MELILLLLACIGFVALTNAMNRRSYEPLASADFDEFVPPGIVSFKIHGRQHAYYGVIYQKFSSYWSAWVASNEANQPYGDDRAYITIIDPQEPPVREVTRHEFAVFLPTCEERADDPHYPMSMIFIRTRHQRYYAVLSTTPPHAGDLSTVAARDEFTNSNYRVVHGVLKRWNPNHQPPSWVANF